MRRICLLVCGIALTVAGCTSGSTTPATVTVTATPTSEEAASTEPTNDILASQFHPCEVLTQEQFEEAGLGDRLNESAQIGWGALGCSFGKKDPADYSGTWLVSTDQVNRKRFEDLNVATLDWGTSRNPELYVHQLPDAEGQCEAAVDYEWGRFTVDYYERGVAWNPEALCSEAAQILDNLIFALGGEK
ncbi:DUF3558 domain-containing protein [Corynebacterium glutamicum]|uniref:DUF3558 domain-containing protein n=1 Tax=Corynebacterium glutamicum TaxID=1718 RepID=UPI001C6E56E2|nr:DUF3558 domain-containing protein [Corynebacterium glutamicum]QYR16865.1 DUF3558 domain-containing protein [Corynebacterium glutamicum]